MSQRGFSVERGCLRDRLRGDHRGGVSREARLEAGREELEGKIVVVTSGEQQEAVIVADANRALQRLGVEDADVSPRARELELRCLARGNELVELFECGEALREGRGRLEVEFQTDGVSFVRAGDGVTITRDFRGTEHEFLQVVTASRKVGRRKCRDYRNYY